MHGREIKIGRVKGTD